ncbi:MAG: hypothetical protein JW893_04570 [Candidatus Omnitrophica bacterium]|nr:hypothetical protein [Candidatus Omnitrophota bacterium]
MSDFEIRFFEKIIKEKPDHIDALKLLAEAYTRKKHYSEGLDMDQRLSVLCPEDPVVHYNLACSLALVGKKEQAIQALKLSMKMGYVDLEHLKKDPDLDVLREDPSFHELIKSLEKSKNSNSR